MSNIFLLSPWCEREYFAPQTSLLYLKYYMADHGYQSTIVDCSHYDSEYDEVVSMIDSHEKPIIGVTAYTRERFHAYKLIRRIKRHIPGSLIVVGGRHFGSLPEETMLNLPEVDIVVRGEGEISMKEICDVRYKNKDIFDVLGISFRDKGKIVHNPDRPPENDLDKFRSFEKQDKEAAELHRMTANSKVDANGKYFGVMTTRGCPNRCVYCSFTSTKARFRSIDSIIQEIEEKIQLTGVRNVIFGDASLTINRHFVEALCNKIIEKKLNIRFNCYSRVNIDLELLKLMKKAGLVSVEIGLETGSPKILKTIRKNINVKQFRDFCETACKMGIKIYVFCMVSLPDETLEDVDMTISLIKNVSKYIYYVGVQTTRIMPDAALYQMAVERGLLPAKFNWFEPYEIEEEMKEICKDPFYYNVPLYVEHLSPADIKKKLDEFKNVLDSHLSNFNILKKAIKYNLSKEGLKQFHPKYLRRKSKRLVSMTYHAYRNRRKEMQYH